MGEPGLPTAYSSSTDILESILSIPGHDPAHVVRCRWPPPSDARPPDVRPKVVRMLVLPWERPGTVWASHS